MAGGEGTGEDRREREKEKITVKENKGKGEMEIGGSSGNCPDTQLNQKISKLMNQMR